MHVQMYTNLLALVELIMNHTKLFIYSKYVLSVCVCERACVCVCIMAPNDKQYPCVIYYLSQAQVEGGAPWKMAKIEVPPQDVSISPLHHNQCIGLKVSPQSAPQ